MEGGLDALFFITKKGMVGWVQWCQLAPEFAIVFGMPKKVEFIWVIGVISFFFFLKSSVDWKL